MQSHKHIYGKRKLARITKIDNKNYSGSAGDMAFIVQTCQCKHGVVIDYGRFNIMKEKLNEYRTPENDS